MDQWTQHQEINNNSETQNKQEVAGIISDNITAGSVIVNVHNTVNNISLNVEATPLLKETRFLLIDASRPHLICTEDLIRYQTVGLNSHNSYRQRHGSPSMSLEYGLNKAAQECAVYYASRKKIDCSYPTAGAGENLFAHMSGNPNLENAVKIAVKRWYDENRTYNYNNPGASTGVTGHFTQLVWKGSTGLGIGAATVDGYTVVVARYTPYGNVCGGGGVGRWHYYKKNVNRQRWS